MSTSKSGDIQFCEGCPAQATFLGPVSEATVEIKVSGPNEADVEVYDTEKYVFFDVNESHVDGMSGRSKEVYSSIMVRRSHATTEGEVKAAAKAASATTIQRIGQCVSASKDKEGKRRCPAFNSTVTRELIHKLLDS